ncbi:macro domain-containing protein [Stutzerimonas stutzeri]|uniref:macro domain-containing protein n=1 Tax=Stutzerimonas stutzeri TaxID=316 RepID=UPI00244887DD|nr:macro domain-containing protein [Stutzerimonas stutzeri]MDH0428076.1 DUF6430 domain-containing protein [Stutzerimonas stutzeri]
MPKVRFFDRRVVRQFLEYISAISTGLSLILIFVDIPNEAKNIVGAVFICALVIFYIVLWFHSATLEHVDLNIEGSTVTVKVGDIFNEPGFKAIAFNEYFDTLVDNRIISEESLNGVFIKRIFPVSTQELDDYISSYRFEEGDVAGDNDKREHGKTRKYSIGTVCVYKDYILSAFSRFDSSNRAVLTMPEFLEFLIKFWDKVNKIYAQKSVSVPIFGSGITRIKEHKNISDEELLKIMLWTFRISEMRFKYPAKLTIVIHGSKIDQINLLDIRSARNGV